MELRNVFSVAAHSPPRWLGSKTSSVKDNTCAREVGSHIHYYTFQCLHQRQMLLLLLLTHLRQVMHPKVKRHDLDSYLVESPIHDTVLLPLYSVLIFSCDQARVDPKCFWFAKAFQPALEREL
jgi:hypothetical protein